MYDAMVKRQAAEAIEAQRLSMLAALYSNPNWDDERNERPQKIEELNASFNRAIEYLYNPELAKEDEQEVDWEHPFWAAAQRAHERALELHPQLRKGATVKDAIELDKDQVRARQESLRKIDQL